MPETKRIIKIGPWEAIPELNLIRGKQGPFFLKPRLMRLLDFFLSHGSNVATREELMAAVWEGRLVTDNLLAKSVSELRQALEEHLPGFITIEAIRGVGYRFVCKPPPETMASPPAGRRKAPQRATLWIMGLALLAGLALIALGWWFQEPGESQARSTEPARELSIHPVTSTRGTERQAAFSPDGANLAYAWRENQSQPFLIYTRHLESSTTRRLTANDTAFEACPAWSPDGQHLAFLRFSSGQGTNLIRKPIAGGEEEWLASFDFKAIAAPLLWNPDGQRLFFAAKPSSDRPFALFVFHLNTREAKQLTHPPDSLFGDRFPCLAGGPSPGLAYMRLEYGEGLLAAAGPGKGEIRFLNLATREERVVCLTQNEITGLAWLPAQQRLLYWEREQEGWGYNLTASTLDGRRQTLKTISEYKPENLSAHPKRPLLLYEAWNAGMDIFRYSPDGNAATWINSTRWEWNPRLDEESGQLAFLSTRTGKMEAWIADRAAPGQAVKASSLNSPLLRWISPGPGGKALLVYGTVDGQDGIYLIHPPTQGKRRLLAGISPLAFPEWSPDGSHFYYASGQSGDWQIWHCRPDGKGQKQVTRHGGYKAMPARHDGQLLFFTRFHENGIWQLNLANGREELLIPAAEQNDKLNWMPAEKGIYYYHWAADGCYLKFFDFQNRSFREVMKLDNIIPEVPGLCVAPDGSFFLIARSEEIEADLLGAEWE